MVCVSATKRLVVQKLIHVIVKHLNVMLNKHLNVGSLETHIVCFSGMKHNLLQLILSV